MCYSPHATTNIATIIPVYVTPVARGLLPSGPICFESFGGVKEFQRQRHLFLSAVGRDSFRLATFTSTSSASQHSAWADQPPQCVARAQRGSPRGWLSSCSVDLLRFSSSSPSCCQTCEASVLTLLTIIPLLCHCMPESSSKSSSSSKDAMGKRVVYTKITPLPSNVPRQLAIELLHSHEEVIELNPLVTGAKAIEAPRGRP